MNIDDIDDDLEDYEDFEDDYEDYEDEDEPLEDMLSDALNGDFVNANKSFNDIMASRIDDALEQEKARISDSVYNGVDVDSELEDEDYDDSGEEELSGEDIDYLESLEDED